MKFPCLNHLKSIALYVSFYVLWIYCAKSGKNGAHFSAYLFPLCYFILMQLFAPIRWENIVFLIPIFFIGLGFDFISLKMNWIQIKTISDEFPLPHWHIAIWLLFIISLPLYIPFFSKRILLSAILAAIYGPLSYRFGEKLELLYLNGKTAWLIYVLFWGLFFPACIKFLSYWKIEEKALLFERP